MLQILIGDPLPNNSVAAFFNAGDGQANGLSLGYTSDGDPLLSSGSGSVQIERFLTGTITTAIGRQVSLDYLLDVTSYLAPGYPVTTSEVDFGHTSRFFVDSQTPDVILTSFSGHNYASPPTAIPTPALVPGLIAMGISVLRQRKQAIA